MCYVRVLPPNENIVDFGSQSFLQYQANLCVPVSPDIALIAHEVGIWFHCLVWKKTVSHVLTTVMHNEPQTAAMILIQTDEQV